MSNLKDITNLVKLHIKGRVANRINNQETDSIEVLMKYVLKAGGGNHLEIGTLFGGSAIAVALAKKKYGQSGMVVCVDPLDGYYGKLLDPVSSLPVTPEILFENIDIFGVGDRIMVMRAKSNAVANLINIKFTTAYIDGDHWIDVPVKDWNLVKDIVSDYVIFDNYDVAYPEVQEACHLANADPDWKCVYADGISYVVGEAAEIPLATLDVMEHNARHTE